MLIFGEEFSLVYGEGFFEAEEQGIRYEAGPVTFLQVNDNVRSKLYKDALKSVTGDGDEVVIYELDRTEDEDQLMERYRVSKTNSAGAVAYKNGSVVVYVTEITE